MTTKDYVLSALRMAKADVSGEELSRGLGISRAAVNGAVKALRAEGYTILSATNRGYRLSDGPDALSAGEMLSMLGAVRMERVTCLSEVDSTNSFLREMAHNGAPEGQVVLADAQTAGRGRMGRSFVSPGGMGLYLSFLLRPKTSPQDTSCLTAWAAVAVRQAIGQVCGTTPDIKWVNDLQFSGKKVCGILTEMSLEGESGQVHYAIIGIGVNTGEAVTDFPPELQDKAASVLSATGVKVRRAALASAIIAKLDQLLADWPDAKAKYLEAYREGCITVGQKISFLRGNEKTNAKATSVEKDFGLTVSTDAGDIYTLHSGEVSVLPEKR